MGILWFWVLGLLSSCGATCESFLKKRSIGNFATFRRFTTTLILCFFVGVCQKRSEDNLCVISQMSSTLIFETGSLTVLEITELARLVGQGARDPPESLLTAAPLPPAAASSGITSKPAFYVVSRSDSMSACLSSTLLTEPSPLLFLNSFSLVIPGEVESPEEAA